MFNHFKQLFIAIVICSVIMAIPSMTILSDEQQQESDQYIAFTQSLSFKHPVIIPIKFPLFKINYKQNMKLSIDRVTVSFSDFTSLLNKETSDQIEKYHDDYQTEVQRQKEYLIQTIDFEMDEELEKEKINQELEADVEGFLEELLSE